MLIVQSDLGNNQLIHYFVSIIETSNSLIKYGHHCRENRTFKKIIKETEKREKSLKTILGKRIILNSFPLNLTNNCITIFI